MKNSLILSGFLVLSFAFAVPVMAADITVVSGDAGISVYGPLSSYAATSSTAWGTSNPAVPTWKHPSWPLISGSDAIWISTAEYTEPTVANNSWRMFKKEITIPGCATDIGGTIWVTSDNAEEVYLNGTLIDSDGEVQGPFVDNQEWNTILDYPLTGLHAGTNILQIIVRNYAGSNSPTANPTGLIFKVEVSYTPDNDCDGVTDNDDLCSDTESDVDSDVAMEGLGVNRLIWDGDSWITVDPKTKEQKDSNKFTGLEYTHGCSCEQILNRMSETTGFDFGGHYKFGCSKSILEDWNRGTYYMGPVLLETVTVPGTSGIPVQSENILDSGKNYFLVAKGTYRFANWGEYGIADAEWSYRNSPYYPTDQNYLDVVPDFLGATSGWVKGEGYFASECGLDVQVDGSCVDWGSFSGSHEYEINYPGTGNKTSFHIYDNQYSDNSGNILVDIFEDKWINLW